MQEAKRHRFNPWVGKIPRREWLPTPVFLPREFHEQWSLVGYSPWGCKEATNTFILFFHGGCECYPTVSIFLSWLSLLDGLTLQKCPNLKDQHLWGSLAGTFIPWPQWLFLSLSSSIHSPSAPSVQFSSVSQSCPTFCDLIDCSSPGFPVHHQLPELAQTHVHRVGDAIQQSHPLSSPSPPTINLSQHQGLFQWVSSLQQVAKVLEFQLQR